MDITDNNYQPKITKSSVSNKLHWRDVHILANNSIFEVMDASRKTAQMQKDFINDQDSTSGPGVVDNIIHNILTIRTGTFNSDNRFGIAVDSLLFESLDWANLEFARTIIFNDLSNQLPQNVNVTSVELSTNDTWDTLFIDVTYDIQLITQTNTWQEPGPQTIGERIASVSLNLKGVRGSNQNIYTNA